MYVLLNEKMHSTMHLIHPFLSSSRVHLLLLQSVMLNEFLHKFKLHDLFRVCEITTSVLLYKFHRACPHFSFREITHHLMPRVTPPAPPARRRQLEEPFSILPLEAMCDGIERTCLEMMYNDLGEQGYFDDTELCSSKWCM